MKEMNETMSPFDFHQGEALLRVAGYYPTLADVIYESVQNALDANAERICVRVNFKKRDITITDDGEGVSRSKFEAALTSICRSIKDRTKLGQFGMGLIAPLGKCEKFTFTSTPKSNPRAYLCWVFNTQQIQCQERVTGIPVESVDLCFDRRGKSKNGVPWRTQVKIINFVKDRVLSRLTAPSLQEGILERFSAVMRRNNTVVEIAITGGNDDQVKEIRVVADRYDGKRLPVEYIHNDDSGQTTFRLYIARKTAQGRRGKVSVGEATKDFRISFTQFAKHAADLLDDEVVAGLTSGVFEGEILSEKVKLDPSRKCFLVNDALVGFCITIESWFRKTGQQYLNQIREEQQDQRYQQLGLRSMRVIEALLRQPEFDYLREVVQSFRFGTTGAHHTPPGGKTEIQPTPSLSTKGDLIKGDGGTIGGSGEPKEERRGHLHYTVVGPKGRQRMLVRGVSTGLQFLYEEMEGSERVWNLDSTRGILRFNTRHPLWAECEPNEKALMRFQEHIALMALTLETAPDDWKERHRQLIDDSLPAFVFALLNGDRIAGRLPGRKTGIAAKMSSA